MSLSQQIALFATRVGTECKALHNEIGDLTNLTTTAKNNVVAAINTLVTELDSIDSRVEATEGIDLKSLINDEAASVDTVYSSSKTASLITAAQQAVKNDLLGGAGEAYDTLKELADLITANEDAIDALEAIASGHVAYDKAQTLTIEQKAQGRTNIDAASATDVGDTAADFVAAFNTALTAA
ncbi:MAG: hypothetical protein NC080_07445 [Paraprevotella sp.]|nr:hypothetical protein [Paraprevotella sp.]